MMPLIQPQLNTDNQYLDFLRYKRGYHPFTQNFDSELNKKLLGRARANNASKHTINIISLGEYFHDNFHEPLFAELGEYRRKIPLSRKNLIEIFTAFLNEQQYHNRLHRQENLNTLSTVSAFELQHAEFIPKGAESNPTSYNSMAEALTDFGTVFFRYLFYAEKEDIIQENVSITGEELFPELKKILENINKYENLKDHYDACLFFNGDIEVQSNDKIFFDACITDFYLLQQITHTVIENQRLNRMGYYMHHPHYNAKAKNIIKEASAVRILDTVKVENGFVKYGLRKRTLEDYQINLEYLVSTLDFYPFYSDTKLPKLNGLSISQILGMHSELTEMGTQLFFKDFPKEDIFKLERYKTEFLPRIKQSVLKSYLRSTTKMPDEKITAYLDLISVPFTSDTDFFSTPIAKKEDYYYFSCHPLSHPNYLHLIDYWLVQADVSLEHRGKALEVHIKSKLLAIEQESHNKFKVIDQNWFTISDSEQEQIDLVIETKNTLIVGEIKCVKYSMQRREYYNIYSEVLQKASSQVNRKAKFLEMHTDAFSNIYSIKNKKIVKVIILNYPYFISSGIENVPVIDANLFTAYFQSGRMVSRQFTEAEIEEVGQITYYTNEDEFCNNLETILSDHPMVKLFTSQLTKTVCSYKLEGIPTIEYSTYVSNKGHNLI